MKERRGGNFGRDVLLYLKRGVGARTEQRERREWKENEKRAVGRTLNHPAKPR